MLKNLLARTAVAAVLTAAPLAYAAGPVIDVYKTATCGCCTAWVDHLKSNGFKLVVHNVDDPGRIRAKFGIGEQYGSCHTGVVNGNAIEGHVPAASIRKLLREKPKARGLAVPGMPMGSPGMEGARKEAYEVLLVEKGGTARTFTKHSAH
ncbi:MAG: DUF411 domain-containing protein [Telluria sp.]